MNTAPAGAESAAALKERLQSQMLMLIYDYLLSTNVEAAHACVIYLNLLLFLWCFCRLPHVLRAEVVGRPVPWAPSVRFFFRIKLFLFEHEPNSFA